MLSELESLVQQTCGQRQVALKGDYLEFRQFNDESWCCYYVAPWSADPTVPVLYFSVYDLESNPITDANKLCSVLSIDPAVKPYLSQTVPVELQKPVWFLHPCHTSDFIQTLQRSEKIKAPPARYWLQWLQAFGASVGLKLDPA